MRADPVAPTRRGSTTWSPRSRWPTRRCWSTAACGGARRAARLGGRPRAGARPGDRAHRPAGRGQQGGPGRAGHPRDRQAVRRGAAARCRRSSTPATSSWARAAGCTARPCPARCRTSSCSPSASRSARSAVITAGNFPVAVPSWYLVPALLCGNTVVWKPAEYAAAVARRVLRAVRRGGGLPAGVLQHRARRRPDHVRRAWSRPWTRGWSTRSASPARPRSARGSASSPAGTCRRPAWSWAARTRWWSRPTPTSTSPSRARCSPASAPPGSAAPRSAR